MYNSITITKSVAGGGSAKDAIAPPERSEKQHFFS